MAGFGFDLVWFTMLLIVVLQPTLLTPPMAGAIFYLRAVAPAEIRLGDRYRGVVPFITLHLVMLGLVMIFPSLARDLRFASPVNASQCACTNPRRGGGFGYKCVHQPEEVAVAWLAKKLARPLRWTEDRRTRQHHYRLTAYAYESGRLLGIDVETSVDVGAYSVWPFTACLVPTVA